MLFERFPTVFPFEVNFQSVAFQQFDHNLMKRNKSLNFLITGSFQLLIHEKKKTQTKLKHTWLCTLSNSPTVPSPAARCTRVNSAMCKVPVLRIKQAHVPQTDPRAALVPPSHYHFLILMSALISPDAESVQTSHIRVIVAGTSSLQSCRHVRTHSPVLFQMWPSERSLFDYQR